MHPGRDVLAEPLCDPGLSRRHDLHQPARAHPGTASGSYRLSSRITAQISRGSMLNSVAAAFTVSEYGLG